MNSDGREVLLHQQLGQSNTTLHCLHKDDHLKRNQKLKHRKSGYKEKFNTHKALQVVFLVREFKSQKPVMCAVVFRHT